MNCSSANPNFEIGILTFRLSYNLFLKKNKPLTFMFVMVEIDVGRLKRDAPEMTIWDPFLELSDRDKSDPSPLPRRRPTSRISNCSDFVKAREDAGFDAEEI